jgi:HlyD family secretion protein
MLCRLGGVKLVPAPVTGEVSAVFVQVDDPVEQGAEVLQLIPEGASGPEQALSVRSPIHGTVLDIAAIEGDIVQEQAILLTVESSEYPLEAVVYLPAADGQRVKKDQKVRVLLAPAEQRETTNLSGRVRVAGKFPASRSGMTRSAYQADWGEGQATLGPTLEVVVAPEDGKWPPELYSGIPCQARITVNWQRPIQLALPIRSGGGGN